MTYLVFKRTLTHYKEFQRKTLEDAVETVHNLTILAELEDGPSEIGIVVGKRMDRLIPYYLVKD